jgi:hypothetical protein
MTQREALWDEDFDYLFDESESRDWWEGISPVEESALTEESAVEPRQNGKHWADHPEVDGAVDVAPSISHADRHVEFSNQTPRTAAVPSFDAREIAPKRHALPLHRSKLALIALAVAAGAVVVAMLMLLLRSPADDHTTTVPSVLPSSAPSASPSAPPSSSPDLSGGVPIETPPLPPPSAEQITPAPQHSDPYHPRSEQPSGTSGPQIDVTRAPMSVAPKPVTPPKTATPGQGSPHHGFF